MKTLKTIIPSILLIIFVLTGVKIEKSFGWGERGHNMTGFAAARLIQDFATNEEKEAWKSFFESRPFVFGHLNNIPDISWRDIRRPDVNKFNDPTHYFDAEYGLGKTSPLTAEDLKLLKNLDTDFKVYWSKMKSVKIEGHPDYDPFFKTGIAPWRVGQLHSLMIAAFTCAKSKELLPTTNKKNVFRLPIREGRYNCAKDSSRLEDIAAAVAIGGVMGHFVSDLSQPFHNTADFDGWATGQGGIHSYLETAAVLAMDDKVVNDIRELAKSSKVQIWKRLEIDPTQEKDATKIALHLSADSYSELDSWRKLDKKYALIKESSKHEMGAIPKENFTKAERKKADDPQLLKEFRPLVVARIATASLVLAELWHQAWYAGGLPKVDDVNLIAVPYPMDVPFLMPPEALISDLKLDVRKLKLEF